MSLLILNQNVFYLILLNTLLYGLTSANQNITIYVKEDGIDQSECTKENESIPCHTLSYILNQINNRSNDTFNGTNISESVYVYKTYSQERTNLSHIQLLVNCILLELIIPFLSSVEITMSFVFMVEVVSCRNITFYEIWVSLYSIVTVSFNKCLFTGGSLTISNCLFHNKNPKSQLIVIDNVL